MTSNVLAARFFKGSTTSMGRAAIDETKLPELVERAHAWCKERGAIYLESGISDEGSYGRCFFVTVQLLRLSNMKYTAYAHAVAGVLDSLERLAGPLC